MKRVLIADEYPLVRIAIRQVLARLPVELVIEEVANGLSLEQKIMKGGWNLIIADSDLPGKNIMILLQKAIETYSQQAVMVLSIDPKHTFNVLGMGNNFFIHMRKNVASAAFMQYVQFFLSLEPMKILDTSNGHW